jgi:hypothetical protein
MHVFIMFHVMLVQKMNITKYFKERPNIVFIESWLNENKNLDDNGHIPVSGRWSVSTRTVFFKRHLTFLLKFNVAVSSNKTSEEIYVL